MKQKLRMCKMIGLVNLFFIVATIEFSACYSTPRLVTQNSTTIITDTIIIQEGIFDWNTHDILVEQYRTLLDSVVEIIKKSQPEKVLIEVHIDERGPKNTSVYSSQERADNLKAFFVKSGFDYHTVEAKGCHDKRPLISNATSEAEHSQNRRVELIYQTKK